MTTAQRLPAGSAQSRCPVSACWGHQWELNSVLSAGTQLIHCTPPQHTHQKQTILIKGWPVDTGVVHHPHGLPQRSLTQHQAHSSHSSAEHRAVLGGTLFLKDSVHCPICSRGRRTRGAEGVRAHGEQGFTSSLQMNSAPASLLIPGWTQPLPEEPGWLHHSGAAQSQVGGVSWEGCTPRNTLARRCGPRSPECLSTLGQYWRMEGHPVCSIPTWNITQP